MKLGMVLGSSGQAEWDFSLVKAADELGYDVLWSSESYGTDAVTPLAWAGAITKNIRLATGIMQMPARSPAMTAMTAMTLDRLSSERFILGLGMSGPQVVEGWHGVPYGKIIPRTREYISIVRHILARETPLEINATHYQIPWKGEGASGLGKPLRSIIHGRPTLPIYLATIGPKNTALAAEMADGWIPTLFSPFHFSLMQSWLEEGFAKAGLGKSITNFEISPLVNVCCGDDVKACRDSLKPNIALYVGGMGAKGKNFYHALVSRYGYESQADHIQSLYLAGKKADAIAAVPDQLVDEVALCGPKERIAERLTAWKSIPSLTLSIRTPNLATLQMMAELVL